MTTKTRITRELLTEVQLFLFSVGRRQASKPGILVSLYKSLLSLFYSQEKSHQFHVSNQIYRHICARQFSGVSITSTKGSQLCRNPQIALMRMVCRAKIFSISITRKKNSKEKIVEMTTKTTNVGKL